MEKTDDYWMENIILLKLIIALMMQAARVELEYVAYGPHGRSTHLQHAILPLEYTQSSHGTLSWKK